MKRWMIVGCVLVVLSRPVSGYDQLIKENNQLQGQRYGTINKMLVMAGECLVYWADPGYDYMPVGGWKQAVLPDT